MDSETTRGSQTRSSATFATQHHASVRKLQQAGIPIKIVMGDIAIIRMPCKPTIELNLRRSRWKLRGQKKSTFGTLDEFIDWYRQTYLNGGV